MDLSRLLCSCFGPFADRFWSPLIVVGDGQLWIALSCFRLLALVRICIQSLGLPCYSLEDALYRLLPLAIAHFGIALFCLQISLSHSLFLSRCLSLSHLLSYPFAQFDDNNNKRTARSECCLLSNGFGHFN